MNTHHALFLLIAATAPSCARATADIHTASITRPPVGARLVAQRPSVNDPALSMDLSGYLVSAPAQIDVRLRIEPDARSRSLTVEWWTPDGVGGSHLITLEGDHAPIRFVYPIKRITEGEYSVSVVLQRNDGSEVRQNKRLIVVGEAELARIATQGIAESESGRTAMRGDQ